MIKSQWNPLEQTGTPDQEPMGPMGERKPQTLSHLVPCGRGVGTAVRPIYLATFFVAYVLRINYEHKAGVVRERHGTMLRYPQIVFWDASVAHRRRMGPSY